jgi:large subunit ribosomal protein L21
MFAVIRTGGKQYRVAKDDKIIVEKLLGEPGTMVELSDVLMIGGDGKALTVGTPVIDKAAVFAEVVEQSRADKIIVFKKNRRKGYRRTRGHRQQQTVLRIVDVSPTGAKPKGIVAKAAPKKDNKPPASKTEAKTGAKKDAPKKEAAKKEGSKKEAKAPTKKEPAKKKADKAPAVKAKAPAKKKPAAKKKAPTKGKSKE